MILEISRGKAKCLRRRVTEPMYVVGADDGCDMVLADEQFPVIHFYFFKRDQHTILRPVSSHPEITINGEPRKLATSVQSGDRIRTGPFEFLLKAS